MLKTQIWKNSDGIIYHDEPIESFILHFTTEEATQNTNHEEVTRYVIEKISSKSESADNSKSDSPQILYGHGHFSLTSNLFESSNPGFNEYYVKFQACCWDGWTYNLTNPDIKLRSVFRKKLVSL